MIKVLSIDNDASIRYAMQALIESQGWEPLIAENMEEGIRIVKEEKPTIALIDYHMPGINGVEGVKMIRKIDMALPIIVFTIDDSQEVADLFMDAGADDFATKPIRMPDLISRIKLHIRLLQGQKEQENTIELKETLPKGFSESTLFLILEEMKNKDFQTVVEISKATGLSQQTSYRYLQYLETEERVETRSSYGKVGRPRQSYKLIEKKGDKTE